MLLSLVGLCVVSVRCYMLIDVGVPPQDFFFRKMIMVFVRWKCCRCLMVIGAAPLEVLCG